MGARVCVCGGGGGGGRLLRFHSKNGRIVFANINFFQKGWVEQFRPTSLT